MYNEKPKNERLTIIFEAKQDIIDFVEVCNKYDDAIDIRADKRSTDAKSIMGMLLLETGREFIIEYGCYDAEDNYEEFRAEILSRFRVKAVPLGTEKA